MFKYGEEVFDVRDTVRVFRTPKTPGKPIEIIEGEIWQIKTTMGGVNNTNHTEVEVFGTPKHLENRPMQAASKRKIVLGENVRWEKITDL